MQSELTTKEKTLQYLQSMSQRDLDRTVSHFAEEVDWFIPGNDKLAPWLGTRKSKLEIKDFFEKLWKETIPLDASIDGILSEGNMAVVVGGFSSKMVRTDKVFQSPFCIQIRFREEKIVYYRLLEDSFSLSQSLS